MNGPAKTPAAWPKLAAFALLAFSPALALRLHPNDYIGGRSRDEQAREQRNASAFAVILGTIRATASDMMFVKTERYLDNGVAFKPHVNISELAQTGETRQQTEPEAVATVIRGRAEDFRAYIGDLERKVKPWVPPAQHEAHTTGDELLPWYRLMTLSDERNTRAYRIGAWWLRSKGPKQVEEAIKFLDEGIARNPEAFELYYMKGQTLFRQKDDPRAALDVMIKAAELAIKQRPPGGPVEGSFTWNPNTEDNALGAVRMAVFLQRTLVNDRAALATAERALKVFVGDKVLERNIKAIHEGRPLGAPDIKEKAPEGAEEHEHEHGSDHQREHGAGENAKEPAADHDHEHDHDADHDEGHPKAP